MDGKASGKQHLAFTDAEINAAASVVKAMIAKAVQIDDEMAIAVYSRLLDATAEAKLRLKYELTTVTPSVEGFEP